MDKVAYNADEAYNIYNNYALWTCFSIRKGKPRYFNGTKNIRQHEFLCFKKSFKMKILVKRKIGRNWRSELAVKHLFVPQLKMMY